MTKFERKFADRVCTYNDKNKLHSHDDQPAIVHSSGLKHWYKNGHIHRDNGPAIMSTGIENYQIWYYNGKVHRIDGPAKTHSDGSEQWYFRGVKHRLDGPAVTYIDSVKWDRFIPSSYCKRGEIVKEWWNSGYRHREDGPAIENEVARLFAWYKKGRRHRIDGPALINDEKLSWFINDQLYFEVIEWIEENNISWPLNEHDQILFNLRFL